MAIPKKHSHIITIDRVEYRYRVRQDRDQLELQISIQRVDPEGQVFVSGFIKPTEKFEITPGRWSGRFRPHAVTPATIRQLILAALQSGWQPAKRGLPAFHLAGHKVVPVLPPPRKDFSGPIHNPLEDQ